MFTHLGSAAHTASISEVLLDHLQSLLKSDRSAETWRAEMGDHLETMARRGFNQHGQPIEEQFNVEDKDGVEEGERGTTVTVVVIKETEWVFPPAQELTTALRSSL